MPECHFRVRSECDEELKSIVIWCRSQSKVYIAVQEIGKNDGKHIHVVVDTSKTISTFRQNFIKQFPNLKGNQSYSLKKFEKDLDHNIRYCCKGTKDSHPVVLFTILTQDEIESAHKKFWEEQKKYLTEHGVKSVDKPTKTTRAPNFKEKVIAQLPVGVPAAYSALYAMYKRSDYEEAEFKKVRKIIIDTVLLCLGKYAKDIDDNIVTRNINGVLYKCVTDYGQPEEKQVLFDRMEARVSYNLI